MTPAPSGAAQGGVDAKGRFSIVVAEAFVRATRDSGYKGTPSAVAELVDNSLQAGARRIEIRVYDGGIDERFPLRVEVLDDGQGMDPFTLRNSLRFGGTSRFNDRRGMGRYGMGLPNSSFSQARRVDVYSWTSPEDIFHSHLDLDDIASGQVSEVPVPQRDQLDELDLPESGTMVVWSRCDRLDNKRPRTVAHKLRASLGRRFRYFIWEGVEILVNGEHVPGLDPLYLDERSPVRGAQLFEDPIVYEVDVHPEAQEFRVAGTVTVTFTELPVHEWHGLSNDEKRRRGISKGAGVSVVRAGREVDYGWFFMGQKRRENYDDWWRCEVRFDPELDEHFGITHTKQQIRPSASLLEALSPDLEQIARALNARARSAYLAVKAAKRAEPALEVAARAEPTLPALPAPTSERAVAEFTKVAPHLKATLEAPGEGIRYALIHTSISPRVFFDHARNDRAFVLALNPDHPFYRRVYKPLSEDADKRSIGLREGIELTLLAAARAAEALEDSADTFARFRERWSDTLAAFFSR